ncbi:MAG: hypothetical protein QM765_51320 [Myxococcales bacterium]
MPASPRSMLSTPEKAMKAASWTPVPARTPAIIPPSTGYIAPSWASSVTKSEPCFSGTLVQSMRACSSQRRSSAKVRVTSRSSGWASDSDFLAMHGPTKTTPTSWPKRCLRSRAWAMTGEGRGVKSCACSGWYLASRLTATGQAVESSGFSGCSRSIRATWAETCWAPSAVSETPQKPSCSSAATSWAGVPSVNSVTKDGASETTTSRCEARSCRARPRSSRTRLACLGQTATQRPQTTHSSAMTVAHPPSTLMAFTGQLRRHL